MVICPWHEWSYDCRTGENDFDPDIKLDRFSVKAEGDDILIDPGGLPCLSCPKLKP